MTLTPSRRLALSIAVSSALFAAPTTLLAAGFYLQEQGVSGLGRAYAGEAAIASDASTIHFNPAGMTRLESNELQAGVHLLIPNAEVNRRGTTINGTPYDGGRDSSNPYDPTPIPNLYWAEQYSDRVWLGFGLTAPFGLKNEYNDDFFARYDSLESDLQVLNLQPSIAFELTDRISIGGGLDLQYAEATLRSATPGGLPPSAATDGEFELEGDNWDVGFNIGMQFDLNDDTRLGIHYRDGITHTLKGTATSTQQGVLPGRADLKLPDIASIGIQHRFNDRWTGLAQYTWFNWSNFDEIRIQLPQGNEQVLEQNYRNSYALAVGAEYAMNPRWTLRGGIQYDQTPTQTDGRSTRTPDGDRTWFSFGASYASSERFTFDLGYSYIHIASEDLDITRSFNGTDINMQGTTKGHVHVLSAAMRYHF
ncbi:aromatic hydrocarbon degradation protein [Thioalkalivibrio versutus]|uniref:Aromatic hydrocarbon degradation protein n=1 Tax=Thioalkalivibrio versutus TaxID=106634 RepID=A0A0G3FZN0_9GAMM|nr:outer membrane protein transport protein [Thioalkalivibrio versutus]AKJ94408.1 aromatic hydrocarbon degradation protein [Thioalkalivibrio versutus]